MKPAIVLAILAMWVVAVTVLHLGINAPRPLERVAEARAIPVGGLPVT